MITAETQFVLLATSEIWAVAENCSPERYNELCNMTEDEVIAAGGYQPILLKEPTEPEPWDTL